jgi:hypothetical protein
MLPLRPRTSRTGPDGQSRWSRTSEWVYYGYMAKAVALTGRGGGCCGRGGGGGGVCGGGGSAGFGSVCGCGCTTAAAAAPAFLPCVASFSTPPPVSGQSPVVCRCSPIAITATHMVVVAPWPLPQPTHASLSRCLCCWLSACLPVFISLCLSSASSTCCLSSSSAPRACFPSLANPIEPLAVRTHVGTRTRLVTSLLLGCPTTT